jgi:hypothetical protein
MCEYALEWRLVIVDGRLAKVVQAPGGKWPVKKKDEE